MRKAVRKNLLKVFQTMHEVHSCMRRFFDQDQSDTVQTLLNDCQQTAIQLGTVIEETEGINFITVRLLEEYCEALYEVSLNQPKLTGDKAFKLLEKKLIKAENSAKNDINIRCEAVFMPYKASMWDSLESVWKAADEDQNCDAYVVPIPYYDRNADGSLGELHYEGGSYPEYVPVMDYEEYSLEERHPDMIYIHSPYDDYNRVTTIDPRFYSAELKKYTECLVYVPYYLANGSVGKALETAPVYESADYIVMQSEKYRKFFDKRIPDEKFLPLGSPKIDAAIAACRKTHTLPEGWKEKISGKKVLFYNTTISNALENTWAFLRKLVYVFNTFSEYRDKVCLLWRPHPLLEATFDSMRSDYKKEYLRLKHFFLDSNMGIYDDNPDITLSIAISDGYMGDAFSSVVTDFMAVGKPLFILSDLFDSAPYEVDRKKAFIKYIGDINAINTQSNTKWVVVRGREVYYSENDDYRYTHFCSLGENESYWSSVLSIGGKNYVCPRFASDIVALANGRIEKRIGLRQFEDLKGILFAGAVTDERNIFLIPISYPAVVRYDLSSNRIVYIFDKLLEISECTDPRVYRASCIHKGTLYITAYSCNNIWAYNINAETVSVHELSVSSVKGFMNIYSDGDMLWLLPNRGDAVVAWNPDDNSMVEYSCAHLGICCFDYSFANNIIINMFSSAYFYGDFVYLAQGAGDRFIKINKLTSEVQEWKIGIGQSDEQINCYSAGFYLKTWFLPSVIPGKCRLLSAVEGKIYEIDLNSGDAKEKDISFEMEEAGTKMRGFAYEPVYGKYCCLEDEFNSLIDIIEENFENNVFDSRRQFEYFSEISNNIDGSAGRKIYEATKQI